MPMGMQLKVKKEPGRSPRSVVRIYGQERIDQMNDIAAALGKRPGQIMEDWIDDVWRQMVATGEIRPNP